AHTSPFTIAIKQLDFYQDPINPTQRQITATLELSHAIAPGELERHTQLAMMGGSAIFAATDPSPHFTLTYGLHHRVAFLRSSSITLPEREDFMKLVLSKGLRPAEGGAQTPDVVEKKLLIPSVATMFRIDSSEGTVTRNKNGEPEQLIVFSTTADISTRELAKALEIRLLPKRPPEAEGSKPTEDPGEETADHSSENTDSDDTDSDQSGS